MSEANTQENDNAPLDGNGPPRSWVLLSETDDRVDAAFLEEELTRTNIPCKTTRHVDGDRVVFRVMVTDDDDTRARQVLGTSIAAPPSPASAAGKSQRLVWGLALVPGCAHFYAGETARGAMLLLAFLSCLFWSAADHMVVLAPFVLLLVDALGARAALQGRRPRFLNVVAWTAPLWVATPVVLQKAAPSLYIGAAGRAVCAAEARCDLDVEDDCVTYTAGQIGQSMQVRSILADCAEFLEGRSCEQAYGASVDQYWACNEAPFCALVGTAEEAACLSLYNGSATAFEVPNRPVPAPRGWGM